MVLWGALHVPLIHRSRFYLAFRGRELFYFEAEHRRLSHLQGQLLPEEESPGAGKQTRRKLESAQRRLEVRWGGDGWCGGLPSWGFVDTCCKTRLAGVLYHRYSVCTLMRANDLACINTPP